MAAAFSTVSAATSPCADPSRASGHHRRLRTQALAPASRRRPNTAAPLRVAGADPEIVKWKDLPPMKNLIKSYKTAFLDGDEKVLYETEMAMCAAEKERNDLADKFESMSAEIASGKEKFLRLNADLENFRKQTEKDRAKFTSSIQVELLHSLLSIVDSFENAKQEITPHTEKEQKISTSYQGIYRQFVETLRSLGVGIVETVGKPFDPSIHEAIAREESVQFVAGIVSQEIRRGFLLRERLLRPATVKVSTGSSKAKTMSSAAEKYGEEMEVASSCAENPTAAATDR